MKNFIYGDLESKYERTEFKKIPGKAPEMIFYNQAGKEMERLNIEKFSRYLIVRYAMIWYISNVSCKCQVTNEFKIYRGLILML